MSTRYLKTLDKYTKLSPSSVALIKDCLVYKTATKGTLLLKEGQIARQIYWVVKGTLRGRIAPKDDFITTWLATKNMFCSAMPSFIKQKPSKESVEVLEDCELICLSHTDVHKLFDQTPEMSSIVRKMAEDAYIFSLSRNYEFQYLSAKERYDSFVAKYPSHLQNIPLGIIASYIGITQQSLSRIRKNS